jgi:hypothetical protein
LVIEARKICGAVCVAKFFKIRENTRLLAIEKSITSFKGAYFPKDVILYAVFFYVRYGVSYRDLEEIMEKRGVNVDHATLNRWVIDGCRSICEI